MSTPPTKENKRSDGEEMGDDLKKSDNNTKIEEKEVDIEAGGDDDSLGSLDKLEYDELEHAEDYKDVSPVHLSFHDLSYSVPIKHGPFSKGLRGLPAKLRQYKLWTRETKSILKPMSGHFLPGRLVAIMGPSGAGKTSFLNLLSRRTKTGKVEGEILISGHHISLEQSKRMSAYVMQEDTLLGNLTPRELITYSAMLRLPRTMPKSEKLDRVEKVIHQLNLGRCADTRVGTPGVKRGISGGERRRVSIGLDLIVNPRLLFLDEPTSGLDSTMAEQVVTILKDLAQQGRTIICTIHQPSSEIFNLFDDVFFLANGSLVYAGPVTSVTKYFKEQGHPCPKFTNPADHYMRLLSRKEDVSEENYAKHIESLESYHQQNSQLVPLEGYSNEKLPLLKNQGPRFWGQLWLLLTRCWKSYIRDPGVTFQRLVITFIISIIVGLLFLQLGHTQSDITNRTGCLFLLVIQFTFMTGNSVLYLFPTERPTFLREYGNGMYGVLPYYIAKSSADLPFHILFPAIGLTIMYWMIGLRETADAFFICLGIIILQSNIAQSVGLFVSVATELPVAMALFPVCIIPLMLVGGLFLVASNIPNYFIWLRYISPVYYAFSALSVNELENETFTCTSSQLVNGVCPITNGSQKLSQLDFSTYDIWVGPICLGAIYLILRILTFLALWLLAKKKAST